MLVQVWFEEVLIELNHHPKGGSSIEEVKLLVSFLGLSFNRLVFKLILFLHSCVAELLSVPILEFILSAFVEFLKLLMVVNYLFTLGKYLDFFLISIQVKVSAVFHLIQLLLTLFLLHIYISSI